LIPNGHHPCIFSIQACIFAKLYFTMILFIITSAVLVLLSFILFFVVLIQPSKEQAAGSTLTSSNIGQVVSAVQAAHLLEKITFGLIGGLCCLSLLCSYLARRDKIGHATDQAAVTTQYVIKTEEKEEQPTKKQDKAASKKQHKA
jgi:protein translocase SecG subunit